VSPWKQGRNSRLSELTVQFQTLDPVLLLSFLSRHCIASESEPCPYHSRHSDIIALNPEMRVSRYQKEEI
jgi:hypothetical protein